MCLLSLSPFVFLCPFLPLSPLCLRFSSLLPPLLSIFVGRHRPIDNSSFSFYVSPFIFSLSVSHFDLSPCPLSCLFSSHCVFLSHLSSFLSLPISRSSSFSTVCLSLWPYAILSPLSCHDVSICVLLFSAPPCMSFPHFLSVFSIQGTPSERDARLPLFLLSFLSSNGALYFSLSLFLCLYLSLSLTVHTFDVWLEGS